MATITIQSNCYALLTANDRTYFEAIARRWDKGWIVTNTMWFPMSICDVSCHSRNSRVYWLGLRGQGR
eukprot:9496534-Pyramimonas_sp.AAC.1